jgi:hypothetical protein
MNQSYRWLTISQAAKHFDKDVSVIRRWCYSGAAVTFGFLVRRDQTRHWQLGIPTETTHTIQEAR